MKKEGLRVQTTVPAAPTTLYLAWLSSEQHGAMTGSTAKIDPSVGGKFSAQNGYISGKLVTLDLGRRIVMALRTSDFPRDAHDSRVEVHFEALGGSTRLTVLHTDIPEGQGEKYKSMWNDQYFHAMRTFFSKYLPDPRKPPPPRRPPPPPEDDEEEEKPKTKLGMLKAKAAKLSPPRPPPKPAAPAKPAPAKAPPAKAAPAKGAPAKPAPAKAAKPSPAKPAPKKAAKAPAKPAAKKPTAKAPAKPAKAAPKKPAKAASKKPAKKR